MRVLIAIDDSLYSQAALEVVKQSYWPADIEFCLCSIIGEWEPNNPNLAVEHLDALKRSFDEWRFKTVRLLEEKQQELQEAFPLSGVFTVVESGNPGEQIVQMAIEIEADLIVLGSHGLSGLDRMILGSVSDLVVSHAPCTVRIIRSASLLTTTKNAFDGEKVNVDDHCAHPRKILVCFDDSKNANAAVRSIGATKWQKDQEFTLLRVVELEHSLKSVRFVGTKPLVRNQKESLASAQRSLEKCVAGLKKQLPRNKFQKSVIEGLAAEQIVEYAKHMHADLILLGADSQNLSNSKVSLGGVARAVINQANCSVIVVHQEKESPSLHEHSQTAKSC